MIHFITLLLWHQFRRRDFIIIIGLKFIKTTVFNLNKKTLTQKIIGDSIVAGLMRNTNIWNNLFGNRFINLGISGDRVENVLWRARDIPFLPSLKNVVILCSTNNINKDSPYDIVQGLIAINSVFKNSSSNPNIFICGILPCDESFSISRLITNEVNNLLKIKMFSYKFSFYKSN